jgi:phage-related protein
MAFRPVTIHGDSLDRLRDFPGVREIRIRDPAGAYRVIYIATLTNGIHVLHAFQKRSQKTAQRDLDLATARLRNLKRGYRR